MKRSRVLVPKGPGQIAPGFNLGRSRSIAAVASPEGTTVAILRGHPTCSVSNTCLGQRVRSDWPDLLTSLISARGSSPSSLRDSGFFGAPCPQAKAWGYLPKSLRDENREIVVTRFLTNMLSSLVAVHGCREFQSRVESRESRVES